jgi:type II secretory pathway component PulK
MENIDAVMDEETSEAIKKEFGVVTRFCETITENVFNIKEVKSTTYIQSVCDQINTVIRKNAKFIPSEK